MARGPRSKLERFARDIARRYERGELVRDIAALYKCDSKTIYKALDRHGVERRKPCESVRLHRPVPKQKLSCPQGFESSYHEEFRRQVYGEARY